MKRVRVGILPTRGQRERKKNCAKRKRDEISMINESIEQMVEDMGDHIYGVATEKCRMDIPNVITSRIASTLGEMIYESDDESVGYNGMITLSDFNKAPDAAYFTANLFGSTVTITERQTSKFRTNVVERIDPIGFVALKQNPDGTLSSVHLAMVGSVPETTIYANGDPFNVSTVRKNVDLTRGYNVEEGTLQDLCGICRDLYTNHQKAIIIRVNRESVTRTVSYNGIRRIFRRRKKETMKSVYSIGMILINSDVLNEYTKPKKSEVDKAGGVHKRSNGRSDGTQVIVNLIQRNDDGEYEGAKPKKKDLFEFNEVRKIPATVRRRKLVCNWIAEHSSYLDNIPPEIFNPAYDTFTNLMKNDMFNVQVEKLCIITVPELTKYESSYMQDSRDDDGTVTFVYEKNIYDNERLLPCRKSNIHKLNEEIDSGKMISFVGMKDRPVENDYKHWSAYTMILLFAGNTLSEHKFVKKLEME